MLYWGGAADSACTFVRIQSAVVHRNNPHKVAHNIAHCHILQCSHLFRFSMLSWPLESVCNAFHQNALTSTFLWIANSFPSQKMQESLQTLLCNVGAIWGHQVIHRNLNASSVSLSSLFKDVVSARLELLNPVWMVLENVHETAWSDHVL